MNCRDYNWKALLFCGNTVGKTGTSSLKWVRKKKGWIQHANTFVFRQRLPDGGKLLLQCEHQKTHVNKGLIFTGLARLHGHTRLQGAPLRKLPSFASDFPITPGVSPCWSRGDPKGQCCSCPKCSPSPSDSPCKGQHHLGGCALLAAHHQLSKSGTTVVELL